MHKIDATEATPVITYRQVGNSHWQFDVREGISEHDLGMIKRNIEGCLLVSSIDGSTSDHRTIFEVVARMGVYKWLRQPLAKVIAGRLKYKQFRLDYHFGANGTEVTYFAQDSLGNWHIAAEPVNESAFMIAAA